MGWCLSITINDNWVRGVLKGKKIESTKKKLANLLKKLDYS